MKDLLKRLASEFSLRDPDLLASTENGREMICTEKMGRKRYAGLPGGKYLYIGWAVQYLLAAAQEFIEAFGLEGDVRVRLADNHPTVGVRTD